MTELLEKAVAEVSKLPRQEQNAIATWLLEELASERRWDKAFAESADVLAKLGEEALAEYHAGLTQELDPEKL